MLDFYFLFLKVLKYVHTLGTLLIVAICQSIGKKVDLEQRLLKTKGCN